MTYYPDSYYEAYAAAPTSSRTQRTSAPVRRPQRVETRSPVPSGPRVESRLLQSMAEKALMNAKEFRDALCLVVFRDPAGKFTTDAMINLFLARCQQLHLDPLAGEMLVIFSKDGEMMILLAAKGWSKLMTSNPAFLSVTFTEDEEVSLNALNIRGPKAITCTIRFSKKERECEVAITEKLVEDARATSMWRQYPTRMLRYRALAQCVTMAFGVSGIYDRDEVLENMALEKESGAVSRPSVGTFRPTFRRVSDPDVSVADDREAAAFLPDLKAIRSSEGDEAAERWIRANVPAAQQEYLLQELAVQPEAQAANAAPAPVPAKAQVPLSLDQYLTEALLKKAQDGREAALSWVQGNVPERLKPVLVQYLTADTKPAAQPAAVKEPAPAVKAA